jgi:hypothetical protein
MIMDATSKQYNFLYSLSVAVKRMAASRERGTYHTNYLCPDCASHNFNLGSSNLG